MKYYLLIFACLIYTSAVKSQSIIAGMHGTADYYYDFTPDTTLFCNSEFGECTSLELPIDINNDGLLDFTIKEHLTEGAMGFDFDYIDLTTSNNCQVSTRGDSCLYYQDTSSIPHYSVQTVANAFLDGDTINNLFTWTQGNCDLLSNTYVAGVYDCHASASSDPDFIIGIRLVTGSDTLYGWIKLKNVILNSYSANFAVQEYACNKQTIGLQEFTNASAFKVYPNPCRGILTIERSPSAKPSLAVISDMRGQELLRQVISETKTQTDISSLSGGIYFIKITDGNCIQVRKIVLE
jgi:hypothetical protein